MYELSRITAKTAINKRDSVHYFDLFTQFLIKSMIDQQPDKKQEYEELQKNLEEIKKSLYKLQKEERRSRIE